MSSRSAGSFNPSAQSILIVGTALLTILVIALASIKRDGSKPVHQAAGFQQQWQPEGCSYPHRLHQGDVATVFCRVHGIITQVYSLSRQDRTLAGTPYFLPQRLDRRFYVNLKPPLMVHKGCPAGMNCYQFRIIGVTLTPKRLHDWMVVNFHYKDQDKRSAGHYSVVASG